MNFYRVSRTQSVPPSNAKFPCVVLSDDQWNDNNFYVTWDTYVYIRKGKKALQGSTKILQTDPSQPGQVFRQTEIPPTFESLSNDFCSLADSLEFYQALLGFGEEIYGPLLRGIRDVVYDPAIAPQFEGSSGFQQALLRNSEAEKAFREGPALFAEMEVARTLKFTFTTLVQNAEAPHRVEMDFRDHPTGLNRTVVLIGRNGTGKTQFLAQFANAMSG